MGARDKARALLDELREANRSLPRVLEEPSRIRHWLRSAHRAHLTFALLLGLGLFVMPPARDAVVATLCPNIVHKGFLGLSRRVRRNPMQAPLRFTLSALYWLGAAGLTGSLLWLQLPGAAAGAGDERKRSDARPTTAQSVATAPTAFGLVAAPAPAVAATLHATPTAADATLVAVQPEVAPARYAIQGELGRGGMGVVYHARDTLLGREVALKQLFPELAHNRELAARFQREAQALARLTHPNVVQIFDLVLDASGMWMAMEMLSGGSLDQRIETTGALGLAELRRLGSQMADALAHAHTAGIVHRDFKPANVMLTAAGNVKVTDFGLARLADQDRTTKLTRPGTMMGSPAYMSPEQITGAEGNASTDVYALGATLYEMAAGRPPFDGPVASVLTQQLTVAPELPPSGADDLPHALLGLLGAMLAKRAAERPSMLEVRDALERL